MCSGWKPKGVTGQALVLEGLIRCVTHATPQPSQQKRNEDGIIYEICGGPSCLIAWIHKTPTRFLKILCQQKQCQLDWKGQRQDEMSEICWTSKILWAENRLIILLMCKYVLPFKKKEKWLQGHSLKPRTIIPWPWNLAPLEFEMTWAGWLIGLSFSLLEWECHNC